MKSNSLHVASGTEQIGRKGPMLGRKSLAVVEESDHDWLSSHGAQEEVAEDLNHDSLSSLGEQEEVAEDSNHD